MCPVCVPTAVLLDRTKTQSLPGETQGPVQETDVQVLISKMQSVALERSVGATEVQRKEPSGSFLETWWQFRWVWEGKPVFPGLQRKTSNNLYTCRTLGTNRLGFKPQFPTCKLRASISPLSRGTRATGGLNEPATSEPFSPSSEYSRCSINGSG